MKVIGGYYLLFKPVEFINLLKQGEYFFLRPTPTPLLLGFLAC